MASLLRTAPRSAVAAFAASAVALGGSVALLGPGVSSASSHREAPLLLSDPQVDNTDVYAFVSPDSPDTTTLIANWLPFQEPDGGPNFYPFAEDAHYNIHIDSNGDARPDITYRWKFHTEDLRDEVGGLGAGGPIEDTFLYNNGVVTSLDDENLLFRQHYTLDKIEGGETTTLVDNAPVAPSNVGPASMPDYASLRAAAVIPLEEGGMSFAGQADDPFFLDLRIFDLLYGADLSERGVDTLAGYNVNSVALQVPSSELTQGDDDPVIGVWSTTERPRMLVRKPGVNQYSGKFVQVSRLGNPLVNEVVLSVPLKDLFNAVPPVKDHTLQPVVDRVLVPEVPVLVEGIYGIPAPPTPRQDLFTVFLTGVEGLNKPEGKVVPAEMLRLNTSIPPAAEVNPLGVIGGDNAGFPNGRRLVDDVVDIELQVLEGALLETGIVEALAKGDLVFENDVPFMETFPYLALPHNFSGPAGGVDAGAGGTAGDTAMTAPDRRSVALSPEQDGIAPWLPMSAAAVGVGFALLGWVVLRRQRGQVR